MPTDWRSRIQKGMDARRREKPSVVSMMSVQYTGLGENGIAEPEKAIGMLSTQDGPRMVHEDEMVSQDDNGMIHVTPSPLTLAKSESDQMMMMDYEDNGSVDGYKCGGKVKGYQYGTPSQGVMAAPPQEKPTIPAPQTQHQMMSPTPTSNRFASKENKDAYINWQSNSGYKANQQKQQAYEEKMKGTSGAGVATGGTGVSIPKTQDVSVGQKVAGVTPTTTGKVELPSTSTATTDFDPNKALEKIATGEHDIFKQQQDKLSSDLSAQARENMMFNLQGMAGQKGLTSGATTNLKAQMASDANAQRAQAMSQLGSAQQAQMLGATQSLLGADQWQQQFDLGKEQWKQEFELKKEQLDKADEIQDKIASDANYNNLSNYVSGLLKADKSMEDIMGNAEVQKFLQDYMGDSYTPEGAQALINDLMAFHLTDNSEIYKQKGQIAMDEYYNQKGSGATLEGLLADTDIENDVAKSLGFYDYNSLSDDDKAQVDQTISDYWGVIATTGAEKWIDYLKNDLYSGEDFWDTPGIEQDLKKLYQDAQKAIKYDDAGNIVGMDESYEFPFDDPDKMYGEYYDITGDDILYGDDGQAQIKVGDEYYNTDEIYYDTEGNKYTLDGADFSIDNGRISHEDIMKSWYNMSNSERDKYLNEDGSIDNKKFIKEQVLNGGFADDQFVKDGYVTTDSGKITEWNNYMSETDGKYNDIFNGTDSLMKISVTDKMYGVGIVMPDGTIAHSVDDLPTDFIGSEDYLMFKGTDGRYHVVDVDKNSEIAKKIYAQVNMADEGEGAMSGEEFSGAFDMENMYVDSNTGEIKNLTTKGYEFSNPTAENFTSTSTGEQGQKDFVDWVDANTGSTFTAANGNNYLITKVGSKIVFENQSGGDDYTISLLPITDSSDLVDFEGTDKQVMESIYSLFGTNTVGNIFK